MPNIYTQKIAPEFPQTRSNFDRLNIARQLPKSDSQTNLVTAVSLVTKAKILVVHPKHIYRPTLVQR